MKIPSVDAIINGIVRTLVRFPLVIASAVLGTVSAILLIESEGVAGPTILFKLLFASALGIPWLFGIVMIAERNKWKSVPKLGGQIVGIIVLVGYAMTVPSVLSSGSEYHISRFFLFALAAHFFVSVAPFIGITGGPALWNYNKNLLFRILGAFLYSNILYLGLTLALVALDNLFGIDVPGKRYGELWVLIAGIFTTWLFLAGNPERFESYSDDQEYPKSFRILVHYVLFPLLAIYIVIIYAYIGKILLSWQWSEGWISRLIFGYATAGVVAVVLVNPLRTHESAGWIKAIVQWFPLTMIPLLIILPLSLYRRISEYGVTEGRYIAVILAGWLIVTIVLLLVRKNLSIKYYPTTLGAAALLFGLGPWNIFAVSEMSQRSRLSDILIQHSILSDGIIHRSTTPVSRQAAKNISSIVEYLFINHGYEGIQPWFPVSLRADSTGDPGALKDPADVTALMGVQFIKIRPMGRSSFPHFGIDPGASIDIQGYDRLLRLQFVVRSSGKKEFLDENVQIKFTDALDTMYIRMRKEGMYANVLLHAFATNLIKEYDNEGMDNILPEKMTISVTSNDIHVKVFLRQFQLRRAGDSVEIESVSAEVAYTIMKTQ